MIYYIRSKSASKFYQRFREDIDSILYIKRFINDLNPYEYDFYLGRIKYFRRFGETLDNARDLALWWIIERRTT